MTDTEVLIIGAGVIGLSAGLELLRRRRRVLVVERREVGAGASGNNAGSCALQNKLLPLIPLSLEAVAIWQERQLEFDREGLDLGYVRTGGFRLAETLAQEEDLHRTAAAQRALGVQTEVLSGDEARAMAPYLGPSVRAAAWCPDDGICDVLRAMPALATVYQRRGGTLWTHTEAAGLELARSGYVVQTARGPVRAERVIVAAGVWARDLVEGLGLPVALRVRINILSVTRRVGAVMQHMISHASHKLTMKQLPVGSVLIGGGWQGEGDYRTYRVWPTVASLRGNWQMAARAVPAVRRLEVLRCWASVDGRTPDDMPLIGEVPGLPGVAIGACCPGGWTIGPAIARALAAIVCGEAVPPLAAPFSPARFICAEQRA
jgi:sarcosine oxidase subunit beta